MSKNRSLMATKWGQCFKGLISDIHASLTSLISELQELEVGKRSGPYLEIAVMNWPTHEMLPCDMVAYPFRVPY